MMKTAATTIQIIVALGLLNVWLIRFHKSTPYRGAKAKTLKEEFEAYGLPTWFTYLVGTLKVSAALLLIAGLWSPFIVPPTALLICVLMLGAIYMHWKIKDPIKKSIPAFAMFSLCVFLYLAGT